MPMCAGLTASTDFPTKNPAQASQRRRRSDAFVTELNAAGSALVYSTYLGGSGSERMTNYSLGESGPIALSTDTSGNTFAYVAGQTLLDQLPDDAGGLPDGFRRRAATDAFVTKYDSAGAVVYSSYLGGNTNDGAYGIAADTAGNAYLTGQTYSSNFPTTPGAFQVTGSAADGFVTKINPAGSGLVYSTYFGGSVRDEVLGIAVDNSGNAYVTGDTQSPDFPTTPGAYQVALRGWNDAFVSKLNATGTALLYSTYLGGDDRENSYGIAVDSSGNAYVTGYTQSTNFPLSNAFQTTYGGGSDAFVAKVNPSLTGTASLVYSSYLGGSGR